jgi:hypothetical protein
LLGRATANLHHRRHVWANRDSWSIRLSSSIVKLIGSRRFSRQLRHDGKPRITRSSHYAGADRNQSICS